MRLFSVLARCGRIIVSFPAQEVVGYNFDKGLHFPCLRLKLLYLEMDGESPCQ